MRENSKSLPVPFGIQNFSTAPCGMYTKPRRGWMAAAVFAKAVLAGIIASNSGSEMATPAPFRSVRRERCFLVRNMSLASSHQRADGSLLETEICAVVVAGGGAAGARRQKASLF